MVILVIFDDFSITQYEATTQDFSFENKSSNGLVEVVPPSDKATESTVEEQFSSGALLSTETDETIEAIDTSSSPSSYEGTPKTTFVLGFLGLVIVTVSTPL